MIKMTQPDVIVSDPPREPEFMTADDLIYLPRRGFVPKMDRIDYPIPQPKAKIPPKSR